MTDSAKDKRQELIFRKHFFRDRLAQVILKEDLCDPPEDLTPGEKADLFIKDRPRHTQFGTPRFRYKKEEYILTGINVVNLCPDGTGGILHLKKDLPADFFWCLCPDCCRLLSWKPGSQCYKCNDIIPPQPCSHCKQEQKELHHCSECNILFCRNCLDVHEHVNEPESETSP